MVEQYKIAIVKIFKETESINKPVIGKSRVVTVSVEADFMNNQHYYYIAQLFNTYFIYKLSV